MKILIAIVISLIVGFAAFFYFNRPAKKVAVKTGAVYYYPKSNIYYSTAEANYYYLANDGAWKSNRQLTEEQKNLLGEKIIITNPSNPVWKDNEDHRLIYSVNTYSSAPEIKKKFFEDSLKSISKKIQIPVKVDTVQKKDSTEENKSAFKKFFQKIFKKKKKG